MKKFIYVLASALAAFICSCTKPEADYIKVSQEKVETSSAAETVTITVSSNVEWSMNTTQTWIKPKRNTAAGTIEIKISANTGDDSREGSLVLKGGSASTTIKVLQNQCNKVIIDGDASFTLAEAETTIVVKLKSNVAYTTTIPVSERSWLSVVQPTKALSSSEITLKALSNDSYETRKAEVVFSAPEVADVKVIVTQMGKPLSFGFHVEGVDKFMLPSISNSGSPATITDGTTTSDFVSSAIISVNNPTSYTVTAYRLESINFSSVIGLTEVDLSDLN